MTTIRDHYSLIKRVNLSNLPHTDEHPIPAGCTQFERINALSEQLGKPGNGIELTIAQGDPIPNDDHAHISIVEWAHYDQEPSVVVEFNPATGSVLVKTHQNTKVTVLKITTI